jgi:hypothetical protein
MKKVSVLYSPEVAVTDVEIEIQKSVLEMCGGIWTQEAFENSKYNVMGLLSNIFTFRNGYDSIKNQITFSESELNGILFSKETVFVEVQKDEYWENGCVKLTVGYFE